MKAMILAAGLGTRLRPLTGDRPKALVEISGRTLLEITLERLRAFGVDQVIVNAHHFADMLADYLARKSSFGMRIEVSQEPDLLDTGGGLKKASWFFLEDADSDEPFILHNVDVISSIDLDRMVARHRESAVLATLAVQKRETSRYLIFDEDGQLVGRKAGTDGQTELTRPGERPQSLGFAGIHVISPRLLPLLVEEGAFPIIGAYLRLVREGHRIVGFRADEYSWRDVGNPESLEQARRESNRPL